MQKAAFYYGFPSSLFEGTRQPPFPMAAQFPKAGALIRVGSLSVKVDSVLTCRPTSVVFRCTDPRGDAYALKAIPIASKSDLQAVLFEHRLQDLLGSDPHIVRAFGCAVDQKARVGYLLLELCGAALSDARAGPVLRKQELIDIFQRACAAVEFMHRQSPPVIHRDVSPENILLSPSGWKLSDFGSATTTVFTQFDDAAKVQGMRAEIEARTAPGLRPPELRDLALRRPLSTKLDVWALGALLFRLCTGRDAADAAAWPEDLPIDERLQRLAEAAMADDLDARPSVQQLLGALYAEFPQLVDPRWSEFAPARPTEHLTVRARSTRRSGASRSTPPPVVGREEPQAHARPAPHRVRHQAIDLGESALPFAMMDADGADHSALLAMIESHEEAPAQPHPKRVRRALTDA
jgi:AP2-associated kinase